MIASTCSNFGLGVLLVRPDADDVLGARSQVTAEVAHVEQVRRVRLEPDVPAGVVVDLVQRGVDRLDALVDDRDLGVELGLEGRDLADGVLVEVGLEARSRSAAGRRGRPGRAAARYSLIEATSASTSVVSSGKSSRKAPMSRSARLCRRRLASLSFSIALVRSAVRASTAGATASARCGPRPWRASRARPTAAPRSPGSESTTARAEAIAESRRRTCPVASPTARSAACPSLTAARISRSSALSRPSIRPSSADSSRSCAS